MAERASKELLEVSEQLDSEAAYRILIVEDSRTQATILKKMMGKIGWEVFHVSDGQGALDEAAGYQPDAVLLDITLPDFSGYEVCKKLKANPDTAEVPIIFMSSRGAVIDKVEAFDCGGVDYLTKPFKSGELQARVKNSYCC